MPAAPVRFSTTAVLPPSLELLRERAGDDVGDAAGRGRHDDLDRLRGIGLGARRGATQVSTLTSSAAANRNNEAESIMFLPFDLIEVMAGG